VIKRSSTKDEREKNVIEIIPGMKMTKPHHQDVNL
jgi:hypothetical protein